MNKSLELVIAFKASTSAVSEKIQDLQSKVGRFSNALSSSAQKLKELTLSSKLINDFQTARQRIEDMHPALTAARDRLSEIHAKVKIGAATTREFLQARDAAERLEAKFAKVRDTAAQLRSKLAGSGMDVMNLGAHKADLDRRMVTSTRIEEFRDKAQKAKDFGGRLTGIGAKAMASGAVVGATTVAPIHAFAELEQASTDLKVSMMGANGAVNDQYAQMEKLAVRLGNKLPGTTADQLRMMTMLTRQGMTPERVLGGVGEATSYLAVQLKQNPEETAQMTSKLQDATRVKSADMMKLTDHVQRAYYVGVDPHQLLTAFAKLSPLISLTKKEGLDFVREFMPLVAMTDQAAMPGEQSGNAIRKVISRAISEKNIKKANEILHFTGAGIKFDFTDGKGEFGGLPKMFAEFQKLNKLKTVAKQEVIKTVFGDDAETLQVVSLMSDPNKGFNAYQGFEQQMAGQASITQRVDAQLGTLNALWDTTKGTFTNMIAKFGEALAPELKETTKWMATIYERVQNWAEINPKLSHTLMTAVKWAGLALLIFGGLALGVGALLGPFALLRVTVMTLIPSMAALNISLLPAALIIGGIVLAIAAVAAAFIYWDDICKAISSTWASLTTGASSLWDGVKGAFAGIGEWFSAKWELVKTAFSNGWNNIKTWWAALDFTQIGLNIVKGIADGIANGAYLAIKAIVDVGESIITKGKKTLDIRSPSRVFTELGLLTTEGMGLGIMQGIPQVLDTVRELSSRVAKTGGAIITAGIVATTPVQAQGGGSMGFGAASGDGFAGAQIVININGAGQNGNEIAMAVRRELEALQRTAQRSRDARMFD